MEGTIFTTFPQKSKSSTAPYNHSTYHWITKLEYYIDFSVSLRYYTFRVVRYEQFSNIGNIEAMSEKPLPDCDSLTQKITI